RAHRPSPAQHQRCVSIHRESREHRSPPLRRRHAAMAGFSLPELSHAPVMNSDSPAFSVVAPLYKEEENVALLQAELTDTLDGLDYEIVFVDDGSTDRTADRIEPGPRIQVLRFEKNAGQS